MGIARTFLIGFIWFAASIDVWCCQWLTAPDEINPLCRWIMVNYGIWTLVGVKIFVTFLATEWLRYLPIRYSYAIAAGMFVVLLILGGVIPV